MTRPVVGLEKERPHMKTTRIEWQEQRRDDCGGWELFDVIAERDAADQTGWAFYEKTSWDVTWIRIPATLSRLAKALIEEEAMESRTTLATFGLPPTSGIPRNPGQTASLNSRRSRRASCGKSKPRPYLSLAHIDRRMGHASTVRRALRIASRLLESQASERKAATVTETREPALASAAEDDLQPHPQGRRGPSSGGF